MAAGDIDALAAPVARPGAVVIASLLTASPTSGASHHPSASAGYERLSDVSGSSVSLRIVLSAAMSLQALVLPTGNIFLLSRILEGGALSFILQETEKGAWVWRASVLVIGVPEVSRGRKIEKEHAKEATWRQG